MAAAPDPALGDPARDAAAAEELALSARGWHGAQLAVLGFIGLCGVLSEAGGAAAPRPVQVAAAVLVLSALVLQCAAVALVAGVAWPLAPARDLARRRRRLRGGVATTFVAVALLALGTTVGWWPQRDGDGPDGAVEVSTTQGTLCGSLRPGPDGTVALLAPTGVVHVPAARVLRLRPVNECD